MSEPGRVLIIDEVGRIPWHVWEILAAVETRSAPVVAIPDLQITSKESAMNPPVFGNPLAGLLKSRRMPQARQPVVTKDAKCARKGHRPPNKDGFCTRCHTKIYLDVTYDVE